MMDIARSEIGVNVLLRRGSGRIADHAIHHGLKRSLPTGFYEDLIASFQGIERPEDSWITSHAIHMPRNHSIALLSWCHSPLIPENAGPIRRVDGCRRGSIHLPRGGSANRHH